MARFRLYFWEANPDRGLEWARERSARKKSAENLAVEPFVVGAVIDLGYCLDLMSANGSVAVEEAYEDLKVLLAASGAEFPANTGGKDVLQRKLDCAVINSLHQTRFESGQTPFDTVRGLFPEGEPLYPNSGFRRKTHIQICVRNQENIKGVFRVPDRHFLQQSI